MKSNDIADLVLDTFKRLPAKAKPRIYPNGQREWTPLSGLVLSSNDGKVKKCVALGTGMRCLPADKLPLAKGRSLHDWHAEVVAMRAFNHYLLNEALKMANDTIPTSEVLRSRDDNEKTPAEPQPLAIRDSIFISMFSTEAPCGDASMELTMSAQDDADPWTSHSRSDIDGMLQTGRGHFGELGIVRRKPSRADAPATLSKSCSDKLAMRQCTSLLSSVTSLLIHPGNAYLHELIIPENQLVPLAIERAFAPTGRMEAVIDQVERWTGGYSFRPFKTEAHNRNFEFARCASNTPQVSKGSNIAAVWTPDLLEVLIGGTKQGNKQFSGTGSSSISRQKMCQLLSDASEGLGEGRIYPTATRYAEVKAGKALEARRAVKASVKKSALTPWPCNHGDDFQVGTQ